MPDLIGFSGLSSSSVTNTTPTTGGNYYISVSDYANTIRVQNNVWNIWTSGSSTTSGITTSSATSLDFGTTNFIEACHFVIEQNTEEAIRIASTPAFLSSNHTQYYQPPPAFERSTRAPLTPEQSERRRQQRLRENARSRRFREAAQHRAENLLRSVLNAEQRAELEQHGYFHVRTQGTNRVYRIERGFQGNIKLMVEGRAVRRYCIHADSRLPHADQMAAQKLMLENNEHEFLRIANMTTIRH